MGYRSYFDLIIYDDQMNDIEESLKHDVIKQFMEFSEDAKYVLDEEGHSQDSSKWYSEEQDMIEFSKKHPSLIFQLNREGEQNDDMCKSYYLNGKFQHCVAEVVYPEFDRSRLEG